MTRSRQMTAFNFPAAYREALARHVSKPGEGTLHEGYELGRAAIDLDIPVLNVAAAHHEGLLAVLRVRGFIGSDDALVAAADFLAEALTASEMVRRGYLEIQAAEHQQRQHAIVIRRLSALLADTSLATEGRSALAEMIQLVAEHACELTEAAVCIIRTNARSSAAYLESIAMEDDVNRPSTEADLAIELTTLDGSPLGTMELWNARAGSFSELAEALARHLAQMVSAALDRAKRHSSRGWS